MHDALTLVVSVIISVGGAAGISSLVTARSIARKGNVEADVMEAKVPVEVDSIAVKGSETAVLSMERSMSTPAGS